MTSYTVAAATIAGLLASASTVSAQGCTSLLEAVQQNGLSKLGETVGAAAGDLVQLTPLLGVKQEFEEQKKVTIFAPEDSAFDAVELPAEGSEVAKILLDHIVNDYLPSGNIISALAEEDELTINSLSDPLMVKVEGGSVMVSKEGMAVPAKVVTTDVETCVGVIHVIDAVIVAGGTEPPAEMPAEPPMEMPEEIQAEPPMEMPEEIPVELPAEIQAEPPMEMPEEVAAEPPMEMPEETEVEVMSADSPDEIAMAPMDEMMAEAPAPGPSEAESGDDVGGFTGETTDRSGVEIEAPSSAPAAAAVGLLSALVGMIGLLI